MSTQSMVEAVPANDAMVPVPMRVERVRRESADTVTLTLEPPDGSFHFEPGQFNMLYVFGVGECAISVTGDPNKPAKIVHSLRAVGSVTRALSALKKGATIGVRGPFGSAWPVDVAEGRDVLVIGGGIGFAPLKPIIYSVLRSRRRFGRLSVLYGARTPGDVLFSNELGRWSKKPTLDLRVTVDRGDPEWTGQTGVVTKLIGQVSFDPAGAIAFVCGPEVMMRFSVRELEYQGVAPDRIYLSMERNMRCAIAQCGHCQWGPHFVCREGPVYRYDRIAHLLGIPEI